MNGALIEKKIFDVAFVRLESAFNDVTTVQQIPTTPNDTGTERLLVVGYPGDGPGLSFDGQNVFWRGTVQNRIKKRAIARNDQAYNIHVLW